MLKILRALNGTSTIPRRFSSQYNQPLSGNDMPRPGGIATFMRLPYYPTAKGKIFNIFQQQK